ncbi:unnamed protein product [Urochloa humidicola]
MDYLARGEGWTEERHAAFLDRVELSFVRYWYPGGTGPGRRFLYRPILPTRDSYSYFFNHFYLPRASLPPWLGNFSFVVLFTPDPGRTVFIGKKICGRPRSSLVELPWPDHISSPAATTTSAAAFAEDLAPSSPWRTTRHPPPPQPPPPRPPPPPAPPSAGHGGRRGARPHQPWRTTNFPGRQSPARVPRPGSSSLPAMGARERSFPPAMSSPHALALAGSGLHLRAARQPWAARRR